MVSRLKAIGWVACVATLLSGSAIAQEVNTEFLGLLRNQVGSSEKNVPPQLRMEISEKKGILTEPTSDKRLLASDRDIRKNPLTVQDKN